ncbi:MAG: UvrB/UvrC motif-containing protein [bacterium]
MKKSLVIASNNAHKVEEIKAVLGDRFELLTLNDISFFEEYNTERGITPTTVTKSREAIIEQTSVMDFKDGVQQPYIERDEFSIAADPVVHYMSQKELQKAIDTAKKDMMKASKELDFLTAARLRDEMYALEKLYNEKFTKKE